jgi:UDP-N-acetyl-D-glucosamine dehydrogenase
MNNQKNMNSLLFKIHNHESKIGIIGLGYVGLPLAIRFSLEGFNVAGFDIDNNKVKCLNKGQSYINHIKTEDITAVLKKGFVATKDYSKINEMDIIIICVPTPLGVHNEPDMSFINNTLESIADHLKEQQLLILESTTYPGTTDEILVPFIRSIQHSKLTPGENFFIGYSPEREDPGNRDYSTKTIPKIVSGFTNYCLELTKIVYNQVVNETVPVSSPKVAEMTKILENIHRAVNIGLVNELKMVTDKMNIDIFEVINAAATKPFGFTPFYPGPGLGGHCIPIDPFYLTWKAKEYGMNTRFIELAGEINTNMPNYVILKLSEVLNSVNQSISGSNILVLGLAYKKNIDDTRESPSLEIIHKLIQLGANVQYSDPYLKFSPKTRKYNFNLSSVKLTAKNINKFDIVVIATDHDDYDYDLLVKESKILFDTRGRINKNNFIYK